MKNHKIWVHINYIFLEIELLEKKSFEICDENQDGGLSWAEVDICEVCILTKKY